ncbi:MAG: nuclear transport factor 2 family protein [Desulfocapsaceae bacterium]
MKDFLEVFNSLSSDNLHRLSEIYTDDIHFVDPAHEIQGLDNLRSYFEKLYANVSSVDFDFHEALRVGQSGYVQWIMNFSHPRLSGGHAIEVPGSSFLQFSDDDKVLHHRDYFDLGSMLYQHLPVIGGVVRAINRRLGT